MYNETVEELMGRSSRAELDGMAKALGINSADYPNKRSLAEVLLRTRDEQRKKERVDKERVDKERVERERKANIQELKKKMTEDTVKGKMAGIAQQMIENREAIAASQAGVQELVNKARLFEKETQKYAKEHQLHVKELQLHIKDQANENLKYVKAFYG